MLTADAVSNLTAVLLPINTVMLIGIVFYAGRMVQKVEDLDKRIDRLEDRVVGSPTPAIVTAVK